MRPRFLPVPGFPANARPRRKSPPKGASFGRLWGFLDEHRPQLVFLFLGGFLLGCHEAFLRLNDLFSQGSQQGTLMPGLLNLWYEQLS